MENKSGSSSSNTSNSPSHVTVQFINSSRKNKIPAVKELKKDNETNNIKGRQIRRRHRRGSSKPRPDNCDPSTNKQATSSNKQNVENLQKTNQIQSQLVKKSPKKLSLAVVSFTCEIKPIHKPSKFWFIRKRNLNFQWVNLETFVTDLVPCFVFETILDINQYDKLNNLWTIKDHIGHAITDNVDFVKEKTNKIIGSPPKPSSHNKSKTIDCCKSVSSNKSSLKTDNKQRSSGNKNSFASPNAKKKDNTPGTNKDANEQREIGRISPKKKKEKSNSETPKELRRNRTKQKHRHTFPKYITLEEVQTGLENGNLIKGILRINPRNASDSFVTNDNSSISDYYIASVANRNRALNGDEVVLKLKEKKGEKDTLPKAVVVHILKKHHPRTAIGIVRLDENFPDVAILEPRDKCLPIIHIPSTNWPDDFTLTPDCYENVLFSAKILKWKTTTHAIGAVTEIIGRVGDIRIEVLSVLKEFTLDVSPFSPDILDDLPHLTEIPSEEFNYREDIRKYCIFTIDPLTARDLDDAVSVRKLENGHYEVGVHISDASFYLRENSRLDEIVKQKANTIYLVDDVFHMLPVELCLHCSLLPGKDKLSFSVFTEIDLEGQIYNTRFARTILNSCTQLAYEHAQQMIEQPDNINIEKLPPIHNGFTANDLCETVQILHKIANKLREMRVENGALRINQVKLLFSLDDENREPTGFIAYEQKEAHRLIEEFMLLANISVAKKIYSSFPDIAFLRCHDKPSSLILSDTKQLLEACDIDVDVSSSKSINAFLEKYITDDFEGICKGVLLNKMISKTMKLAKYFCAATREESDFAHYALSVPFYTHFTSPIRRYPDIMVHRLLAASLGYIDKPNWKIDEVQSIANNCNNQKLNAKRASEACSDFYLSYFVKKNQPFVEKCVVVDIKNKSFEVVVIKTGSVIRINQNLCEDNPIWKYDADLLENSPRKTLPKRRIPILYLKYSKKSSEADESNVLAIKLFSVVNVSLSSVKNSYKLEGVLLRSSLLI